MLHRKSVATARGAQFAGLLAEHFSANGKQLLGPKHSSIIRDEALRRTKLLHSRIQYNEHTSQILALKELKGMIRQLGGMQYVLAR